jgi:TolB-like protein/Flp pilus assembly protein TadD
MALIAELKRRNVIRMAGLYLVGAWLVVQVSSTVLPMFNAPSWLPRSIVIVLAVGFVPTLIFCWVFELTPDGIMRDQDISPEESIAPQTARRMDRAIIVVLALAFAYFGFDKFVLAPRREAEQITRATKFALQQATHATNNKSIAVLPFENLSEDKANAYFAAGMQDEILTRLAGIHDLKVISRTSTEQYASHPPNLKIVAEQLGVATVLEGSVQKADGKVRINLQLIDARSDSHLWAQNYDRDLKDVFAVQSDVAEKVADALKAQLLPAESARIASVPTQDPEAYDLYLRAGNHANRAFDQDALVLAEMPQAIVLYQQALERDPRFALAASALATAHMYMYWYASDHATAHLAAGKAAAEHALALKPNLGEGHLSLALYYYWGHRDYAQALQQLDLARRTLPNNADLELVSGSIARRQGHWDDAIASYQRAMVLGPRSSQYPGQLGQTYQVLRRYALAEQVYAKAATLTEDAADERVRYALNDVIWKGDLTALRSALSALHPDDDGYAGNAINFYHLRWWSRDYRAAAETAQTSTTAEWIDRSNVTLPARLYLAWAYEALGERAQATGLYTSLKAQMTLVAQSDDPNHHLTLAFADAGLGLRPDAVREGQKVAALMPVSIDALSGPDYLVFLAQLQVRLGDNDSALDLLRQLSAIPAGHVVSPALLKLDPAWDPLRKDPRFKKLIADAEAAQAKIKP